VPSPLKDPVALASLRALVRARFPDPPKPPTGCVPTGVAALDTALGGGLPIRQLTELVSGAPSSGGQSTLGRLLSVTRAARQRVALVDGAEAFDPLAVPPDDLAHLVWVRTRSVAEALAVADVLVRDPNYAAVVLDLRGCGERSLRTLPATAWYRLQRAAETGSAAVLIQTEAPQVAAAAHRLLLPSPWSLAWATDLARAELAAQIAAASLRGRPTEERATA